MCMCLELYRILYWCLMKFPVIVTSRDWFQYRKLHYTIVWWSYDIHNNWKSFPLQRRLISFHCRWRLHCCIPQCRNFKNLETCDGKSIHLKAVSSRLRPWQFVKPRYYSLCYIQLTRSPVVRASGACNGLQFSNFNRPIKLLPYSSTMTRNKLLSNWLPINTTYTVFYLGLLKRDNIILQSIAFTVSEHIYCLFFSDHTAGTQSFT